MPPWLYALLFISVLLMVAWAADRRNSRARRGLVGPATVPLGGGARRAERAVGDAAGVNPGSIPRQGRRYPAGGGSTG